MVAFWSGMGGVFPLPPMCFAIVAVTLTLTLVYSMSVCHCYTYTQIYHTHYYLRPADVGTTTK